jgi:2-polyprenyl-3-methyl-5-hydroxy-6-metoxy-1,4-benzoquinol methylase
MNENLGNIYTHHHKTARQAGFSILKDERGALLAGLVGRGKKVLDIGCRDGALTKYFATGNDVVGIDIDDAALSRAKELGIEVMNVDLNGDWTELEARKFDVVVAGEVLEHLYYPEKVAGKAVRHLNPGGKFIGSVPNAFSLKNRVRYLAGRKAYTPLSDPTHITQFHINELDSLLRRHFREVEIRGLGRYKRLARLSPGLFGFDLFFIARV